MEITSTQFAIGQVVRHRHYPFRGVIVDVDPVFNNTEEWYDAIPEEVRPHKDQPFYHLLAENDDSTYMAYVSEQNLLVDDTSEPLRLQAEAFVRSIEQGVTPEVSAEQGYAAVRLAERITEAVKRHAWDGDPTGRVGLDVLGQ